MEYMTAKAAAKKWGISPRRVHTLCAEGRIEGAARLGNAWAIPKEAKKPQDARVKSGKYIKQKNKSEEKMNIKQIEHNGVLIAVIQSNEIIITDAESALDLMATVRHETDCERIIISKTAVTEELFILSTGIAGEILQKFVTYHFRLAIVGDFSCFTSKPLRDFIYESNNGKHIFFVETEEEAIMKLANT